MHEPMLDRLATREVDRRAIAEYGMSGLVLMENAGRGVVDCLLQLNAAVAPCGTAEVDLPGQGAAETILPSAPAPGPVVLCCGKGNNAGDGFVVARHLDIHGVPAHVLLFADPAELAGDARTNFDILRRTEVPIDVFSAPIDPRRLADRLVGARWVVDALLGTGARGEPRPPLPAVIDALNRVPARKLAVDLPSGLDCDTGRVSRHTFRADHTCTFVAAKPGFFASAEAAHVTGTLHVIEIGVPRKLVEQLLNESSRGGGPESE